MTKIPRRFLLCCITKCIQLKFSNLCTQTELNLKIDHFIHALEMVERISAQQNYDDDDYIVESQP